MRRIPLVDLKAQHAALAGEVKAAVSAVIEQQSFILGETVARFERELAATMGRAEAVGVASCTDALRLALMALDVGPGDAVITTPLTFVASAEAIVRVGATPVFVDVEDDGFNLCPRRVAEMARTFRGPERLKAILVVHLFGACADMKGLLAVAGEHGLRVVEDAAQAIGATRDGTRAGAFGDVGCFSFFPSKTLGAWGDGGALITDDAAIAARVRRLRQHGVVNGRVMEIGENSRLDALQAAVLSVKLRHLDAWCQKRREVAERYRTLADHVVLPFRARGSGDTFNPFVVRTRERDRVLAALRDQCIEARKYYDRILPDEPAFATRPHHRGDLSNAERAAGELLALPLYPELTEEEQSIVIREVQRCFRAILAQAP
jgi:dTDP-4-amino-4,6-dideoxygalactose transaminase